MYLLLGIQLTIRKLFSPLPYLFIYYQFVLIDSYFIQWVIHYYCYIVQCSNYFRFDQR